MKITVIIPVVMTLLMTACVITGVLPTALPTVPWVNATATIPNTKTVQPTQAAHTALVPDFKHIILIVFENQEASSVIGNPQMPVYNQLAETFASLEQFYAVAHPSLPNYLALMGGDTFGVQSDCSGCFINAPSLADQIEASGRSWKAYEEDMPSACFIGSINLYAQKHDPFIYFDPIRLDATRCANHIVPFSQMQNDLTSGSFPDFAFLTPNMCHDAHNCPLSDADAWLDQTLKTLLPNLDAVNQPYLVILTWDEGQGSHSCCGLPAQAGGRVATVLISPQAKSGFKDETPYTLYSLLKTIEAAWNLPYLGHAAEDQNGVITAPWKAGLIQ